MLIDHMLISSFSIMLEIWAFIINTFRGNQSVRLQRAGGCIKMLMKLGGPSLQRHNPDCINHSGVNQIITSPKLM